MHYLAGLCLLGFGWAVGSQLPSDPLLGVVALKVYWNWYQHCC